MKQPSDLKSNRPPAILLVGEPKAGKTRVAFAFPDPWVLDVDRNLLSAARISPTKTFWYDDPYTDDKGNLITDNIREIKDKDSTRWMRATNLIKEAARDSKVKTIIIDGLTGLSEMLVNHLMFMALREEGKSLDRLRIQDYQPLKTLLTSLVVGLRNCGKTIIFTSHQTLEKDEKTGKIGYVLSIPGRLSDNLGGFFTDTWLVLASNEGGKVKHQIITKPTGFHTSIGSLYDLADAYDITGKTPEQIWTLVGPKLI